MADSRVKHIRLMANDALRRANCDSPPVPIEEVARSLGAKVLFAPYEGDDLAGMLINGGDQPIIAVNSAHHKHRQRFTIAHECGHLVLGHSGESHIDRTFEVIRRDAKSSLATDISEVEANQYAAELLMPLKFLVRDLPGIRIDFESDEKVASLAKRYGVSAQAMAYRIANLFM
ncbi:ImmA/IrrE family metallo-endopeptidase [Devosia salina]|uniref:ImmA/IrrE family metallo-endopeptidase n=1 Tax=Devosia salina TaxID=2860336 RepID=A0ABX8WLF4_9HYPH|nr:ImmA/IrrE family metallo-endopeptidase [Devosia salina]QYO77135.1 ImmA/IrrE family metallo-endopeptidase [Devosia salina]